MGFIQSACCGGTALSALLYGLLGDVMPMYIVFAAGNTLSLLPMMYLCFNKQTKAFITEHGE